MRRFAFARAGESWATSVSVGGRGDEGSAGDESDGGVVRVESCNDDMAVAGRVIGEKTASRVAAGMNQEVVGAGKIMAHSQVLFFKLQAIELDFAPMGGFLRKVREIELAMGGRDDGGDEVDEGSGAIG